MNHSSPSFKVPSPAFSSPASYTLAFPSSCAHRGSHTVSGANVPDFDSNIPYPLSLQQINACPTKLQKGLSFQAYFKPLEKEWS